MKASVGYQNISFSLYDFPSVEVVTAGSSNNVYIDGAASLTTLSCYNI